MSDAPRVDSLSETIARTTAALDLAEPRSQEPWRFARCWMLETRFEEFGRSLADLDLALSDFDALPTQSTGRPRLAAVLANTHVRAGLMIDPERLQRAVSLARIADADPNPLPGWPAATAVIRAFQMMHDVMNGRHGYSTTAADSEGETWVAMVGSVEPNATLVELARIMIRANALMLGQGPNDAEHLVQRIEAVSSRLRAQGIFTHQLEYMTALIEAKQALEAYDVTKIAGLVELLKGMRDKLPAGHHLLQSLDSTLGQFEPMLHMFMPGGPMDTARWAPGMATVPVTSELPSTDLPDLSGVASPTEEATKWSAAATRELVADPDSPERVDRAIIYMTKAVDVSPEYDPRRPGYLMILGYTLLLRFEERAQTPDLVKATQMLEEARASAGIEYHRYWTICANPLAHAYRLAGKRDLGRRTALDGLRGYAWEALLQTRSTDLGLMVREPADTAIDVARWCLSDGDAAAAAAALDAGRSLILYAAMERRDVVSRLREHGEDELARAWAEASAADPDNMPLGLRKKVIGALSGVDIAVTSKDDGARRSLDDATRRLLDTPDLHEVRAALGALNLDALVYLMPGDDGAGAAIIVPAQEPVTHVFLPRLNRAEVSGVDSSLIELSNSLSRAATGEGPEVRRDLAAEPHHQIADVSQWAWDVVMGPLLERHLSLPPDRPFNLVLIAMQELSRVPWHAARRIVDGRYEYALSRVRFSYTPSARMLCDAAWRRPTPNTPGEVRDVLIVADPVTSGQAFGLPAARMEAEAIRDVFYPSASYLGRTATGETAPDGEGTLDQLTSWLSKHGNGALLHLAVHGFAGQGRGTADTSYLLLAGDPGRLSAERMVNELGGALSRDVELAVLAGCRTGETTRGFDEAFSIGTALLATGVRTVISSLWSVPDNQTSVLMYLFHHYLRDSGLGPADALRQAQLAMIENRPLPTSMPEALRRQAAEQDTFDILSWAAFFHSGR